MVGDPMGRGGVRAGLGRIARIGAIAAIALALAQCGKLSSKVDPKYGVSSSPRVVQPGEPVPKGGGTYRVGKPYTVAGRTYVPEENASYSEEGMASWYGEDFHGRLTANGEVFDMESISAAHPTLPIPSYVRVTNLANKRSLIVRVNDRGPYHQGRADRRVGARGEAARLPRQRRRAGAGRVCRPRLARRLRRQQARGDVAPRHAGAGASAVMVASARPFLPQFFDPTPAIRGPVPTPTERPFDLGHERARRRGVAKRATAARSRPRSHARRSPRHPAARRDRRPSPRRAHGAPAEAPSSFEARFAPSPAEAVQCAPSRLDPVSRLCAVGRPCASTARDNRPRALLSAAASAILLSPKAC